MISGFGRCSQRAGAEIGAGPDLYTACQVLIIHPDTARQFAKPGWVGPACQVPNHTGMHCLPISESLASSYVDVKNRQRVFGVLTAECCVGIFISVRKKGPWVNRVWPDSLSVLP